MCEGSERKVFERDKKIDPEGTNRMETVNLS
jgi:hypothetical protein